MEFFKGLQKRILIGIATIMVLVGVLQITSLRTLLNDALWRTIASESGWELKSGKISLLFPLAIQGSGIKALKGDWLVEIEEFYCSISLSDLLLGDLYIPTLQLRGISVDRITCSQSEDEGGTSLDSPGSSFAIGEFYVSSIRYESSQDSVWGELLSKATFKGSCSFDAAVQEANLALNYLAIDQEPTSIALKFKREAGDWLLNYRAVQQVVPFSLLISDLEIEGDAREASDAWLSLITGHEPCDESDMIVGQSSWMCRYLGLPISGNCAIEIDRNMELSLDLKLSKPMGADLKAMLLCDREKGIIDIDGSLQADIHSLELPWIWRGEAPLRVEGHLNKRDGLLNWQVKTALQGDYRGYPFSIENALVIFCGNHGELLINGSVVGHEGHVSSSIRYSDGVIDLEDISLRADGVTLQGDLKVKAGSELSLEGELKGELGEVLGIVQGGASRIVLKNDSERGQCADLWLKGDGYRSPVVETGALSLEFHAEELFGRGGIELQFSAQKLFSKGIAFGDVEGCFNAERGKPWRYHIDYLLSKEESSLALDGRWRLKSDSFSASLEHVKGTLFGEEVSLETAWDLAMEGDFIKVTPLEFHVGEHFFRGSFADEEELYRSQIEYRAPTSAVIASASLDKSSWQATVLLDVQRPQGDLKSELSLDLSKGSLEGIVKAPPYEGRFGMSGFWSQAPLAWDIELPLIALSGEGELSPRGIKSSVEGTVDSKEPLEISAQIFYPWGSKDLEVSTFELYALDLQLLGQGAISVQGFEGRANLSLDDVPSLSKRLGFPLPGQLDGKMNFNLLWNGDGILDFSASYQEAAGSSYLENVAAEFSLLFNQWEPEGQLKLHIAESKVELKSSIGKLHEQSNFEVLFNGMRGIEGSWVIDKGFTVSLVRAEFPLGSHFLSVQVPWRVNWYSGVVSFDPLSITIDRDGLFDLTGYVHHGEVDLHCRGEHLDLNTLFRDFSILPLHGNLAFQGHLSGPLSSPEGVLHLDANALTVADLFFQKAPRCQAIADLELRRGGAVLKGLLQCPSLEPISFHTDLPVDISISPFRLKFDRLAPFSLDVRASGAIAPLLDLFVIDSGTVFGYLSAAVNVRGSLEKPLVDGLFSLAGGGFEGPMTGTMLKDISLRARAEGSLLKIEEFKGHDAHDGTFSATGSVTLDPLRGFPFSLNSHFSHLLFFNLDAMRSFLDGDLSLQGDLHGAKLAGALQLVSPQCILPEEFASPSTDSVDVTYINIPAGKAPLLAKNKEPSIFRYPVELDVILKTQPYLTISSSSLQSTWQGSVQLSGELKSPLLNGELKIQKGQYHYGRKEFELNEGVIVFNGPWEKTSLYTIAKVDIDDVTVEVIVRGPLKNTTIAFRSNPALCQQEILSYLLFGKGLSDITPYQGNQLSRSISSMGHSANTPKLFDKLRTVLPVDLTINRSPVDGGKVSVQVGHQLTPNVYVSLNRSITDDSNGMAVEAKLVKNLKLRGEINENAETQLFIKWKTDF